MNIYIYILTNYKIITRKGEHRIFAAVNCSVIIHDMHGRNCHT